MDEQNMLDQIADSAEGIRVPRNLEPDRIERRICMTKQAKGRIPYERISMAAAVLLIALVAVWQVTTISLDGTVKEGIFRMGDGSSGEEIFSDGSLSDSGGEILKGSGGAGNGGNDGGGVPAGAAFTDETETGDGAAPEDASAGTEGAAPEAAEESVLTGEIAACEDASAGTEGAAPEAAEESVSAGEIAAPEDVSAETEGAAPEAAEESVLTGETAAQELSADAPFQAAESYSQVYTQLKEHFNSSGMLYDRGGGALTTGSAARGIFMKTDTVEDGAVAEMAVEEEMSMAASQDTANSGSGTDAEDYSRTNLQEAGVDEGDVVKTDGTYLYIMDGTGSFRIVRAEGNDLTLMSDTEVSGLTSSTAVSEMYLDGDTLILICTDYGVAMESDGEEEVYWVNEKETTKVYTYDVADRSAPVLKGKVEIDGSFCTSRKNGNYLYVFSEYYPLLRDEEDESEYIPTADGEEISAQSIYLPKEFKSSSYLLIASIDLEEPDRFQDWKAFVSGAADYYVSTDNIYLISYEWTSAGGEYTRLLRCSYKDGKIVPKAAGSIRGYLNNSFSVNEYNGYLRAVATVTDNTEEENVLYVLDENLELCGQIRNLAPGETIRSARFFGDTGYFVTYRNMDPLFSVDLSDPANPVILGELKITGFSSYLHFYGENKLLGVGYETDPDTGAMKGIKLSMFDISDPSDVQEVSKYVIKDAYSCSGLSNYKAILADPNKNLIGLAVERNYLVFSYDEDEGFRNLMTHSLKNDADNYGYVDTWNLRGCYIGSTFYLANKERVVAFDMEQGFIENGLLKF